MAKRANKKGKGYFRCGECGLWYNDAATAGKCEEWCRAHKSCNIEITEHSVIIR
jgi:hypothetical protein